MDLRLGRASIARTALLIAALTATTLAAPSSAAPAAAGQTYSGTLTSAISAIPVRTESRAGYDRSLFRLWTDADGDGCDTRAEVLLEEADAAPTRGAGCSLSGGRWYSYYEGASQTSASALDIDHVVPLAEVWDSGGSSWSAQRREDYANDLGDSRTLVAVTASLNRSKADQDVAEWLPPINHCRYVKDWVASKIRWSLSQDSAERAALQREAGGCTDSTITVTER